MNSCTVISIYLENVTENHRKFYEIAVVREGFLCHVVSTWGRIATQGKACKVFEAVSMNDAMEYFHRVKQQKLNKGYAKTVRKQCSFVDWYDFSTEPIQKEERELPRFKKCSQPLGVQLSF